MNSMSGHAALKAARMPSMAYGTHAEFTCPLVMIDAAGFFALSER